MLFLHSREDLYFNDPYQPINYHNCSDVSSVARNILGVASFLTIMGGSIGVVFSRVYGMESLKITSLALVALGVVGLVSYSIAKMCSEIKKEKEQLTELLTMSSQLKAIKEKSSYGKV